MVQSCVRAAQCRCDSAADECGPPTRKVNKQVNDKERAEAAMQSPDIAELVNRCLGLDAG